MDQPDLCSFVLPLGLQSYFREHGNQWFEPIENRGKLNLKGNWTNQPDPCSPIRLLPVSLLDSSPPDETSQPHEGRLYTRENSCQRWFAVTSNFVQKNTKLQLGFKLFTVPPSIVGDSCFLCLSHLKDFWLHEKTPTGNSSKWSNWARWTCRVTGLNCEWGRRSAGE